MTASTIMASRPLPPPSWTPTSSRGIHVDARRAIIPASLGVLAVLALAVRPPWYVLVAASTIVPAFYAWTAWYVHRHLRPFEAQFTGFLTRNDVDGLWSLYRDAKLLRWLAPNWVMLSKLGLILSIRGEHKAANNVLEEAYELSPKQRRVDLLGPIARTKYELGDFDALKSVAAQWRARSLFPGAASVYLAAAYVEDPREDSEQARELLEEAKGGLTGQERQLRERLLAKLGDAPESN